MKFIIVGSPFPNKMDEIVGQSKGEIQYAANSFQQKLLKGFEEANSDFVCISAPIINSFPFHYKKMYYSPNLGSSENPHIVFTGFNNLFGYRNLSRKNNILKKFKEIGIAKSEKIAIISYSPSMGYIDAAIAIKKYHRNSLLFGILPDLPQFVNVGQKKTAIFRLLKKMDIKNFYRKINNYDGLILLSEHMNEFFHLPRNRYLILEGISDSSQISLPQFNAKKEYPIICYCGTLFKSYGIENLLSAFDVVLSSYPNAKLHICGGGDMGKEILAKSMINDNIIFHGQVDTKICKEIERKSDILVNPRSPDDCFVKYSFPSKTLEYLECCLPVVCYDLPCFSADYKDNMFISDKNSLGDTLIKAYKIYSENPVKYSVKIQHFISSKNELNAALKIINFVEKFHL